MPTCPDGSNMQRQAVPLIRRSAIVGTGLRGKAADARVQILADGEALLSM